VCDNKTETEKLKLSWCSLTGTPGKELLLAGRSVDRFPGGWMEWQELVRLS